MIDLSTPNAQPNDDSEMLDDEYILPEIRNWTVDEKKKWFRAWKKHEFDWVKISKRVGTKDPTQCKLFRIK